MNDTLALCIINRNDGVNLERLINAARPHVDEIVVVDTGSTDDSIHRARGADVVCSAPELLHSDGELTSFSAARQLSFDLAISPWKMWLDTDDDLSDWDALTTIRDRLVDDRRVNGPGASVKMAYKYTWNASRSQCVQVFNRERIIHADDGWTWRRPIHEYMKTDVTYENGDKTLDPSLLHVVHLSQGARSLTGDRNFKILKRWLASEPETEPDVLHYYLADEYLARGMHDDAIREFSLVSSSHGFWSDAMFRMMSMTVRNMMGRAPMQKIARYIAETARNVECKEVWLTLAMWLIGLNHTKHARTAYDKALEMKGVCFHDPTFEQHVRSLFL